MSNGGRLSYADYIHQVLDFGAARDGVPAEKRGRRIVVNIHGREIEDVEVAAPTDPDAGT